MDDDASNATHHLLNWHIWLFLACLALLGWLWGNASPAAAQSPPDPALSVTGSGGLAVPGGEVSYYVQLLNWTDGIVPNGVITHTLPPGFSYLPGSTQVTVGGWPITHTDPISQGASLTWGPFQLPAAGHTAHNPYGAHTFVQDLCLPAFIDFQLDQALALAGSGGYVTQLFYRITPATTSPDPCAVYFVNAAYDRNLVPILRLQGVWNPAGFWQKPDPGPSGDYAGIAAAFARYVEGLPRRNTHPLYVTIWNEPDLWVEWSGAPNAGEYGRFFVAVSNAIRGLNDHRIRILNGAVTPANTAFIRQLLAVPGFTNAFDAWASHCYPYNHPPWYNIHQRTARYGNTVIDCYIQERDAIARYGGRTGFKFVIKETGHGLGDNLYAFEGFPRINETNRASYIASAFRDYWRTWPEIIAVTPFELGDPWSGWEWLDWVNYTVSLDPFHFSMTPHAQYNVVAVLAKPRGATLPHGFEVTFRARVAGDLPPGTYTSQLHGSAAVSASAVLSQAAPVQVVAHLESIYLPAIGVSRNGGVWYMRVPTDDSVPQLSQEDVAATPHLSGTSHPASTSHPTGTPPAEYLQGSEWDGAIVPTHFLTAAARIVPGPRKAEGQAPMPARQHLDGMEPNLLVLDERWSHAYVGLKGGGLALLNLSTLELEKRIRSGSDLETLAPGPEAGTVYGALSSGQVVLIDVVRGEVVSRAEKLGHPRGLVFDPSTGSLLVADAQEGTVVRFSRDLSARLAAGALDDLPDQILLDSANRRLYVMLPGARRVAVLDADSLRPVAQAELVGGPLIEMALDAARGRVYVLSALSPQYRGISVLRTGDLASLALVAGRPAFPLKQATALALAPDGHLLVAEGTDLYRISPEDFSLVNLARLEDEVERGGLVVDPATGRIIWIDSVGVSAAGSAEMPAPPSAAP